jgi:hypothetical protein
MQIAYETEEGLADFYAADRHTHAPACSLRHTSANSTLSPLFSNRRSQQHTVRAPVGHVPTAGTRPPSPRYHEPAHCSDRRRAGCVYHLELVLHVEREFILIIWLYFNYQGSRIGALVGSRKTTFAGILIPIALEIRDCHGMLAQNRAILAFKRR